MPRVRWHARAVSAAGALWLASATAMPVARAESATHVVQPGENLWRIAEGAGTDAASLAQLNGLDETGLLQVGQTLNLPAPAAATYTAAEGDTLTGIAQHLGTTTAALLQANALDDPNRLAAGQVLVVPSVSLQTAMAAATPKPAPSATPAPSSTPGPSKTKPSAAANVAPSRTATPAPAPTGVKPAVVATVPPGAPTDGLAGLSLKLLGDAYVWGGSSPAGFDCSGFIWYVARQANKSISRDLQGQYNAGPHPARDQLQVGDLVFFQDTYEDGLSHNGVYIGNGLFAHAADEAAGVTLSKLDSTYWSSHWFGATRLP